jgi:HK97 family phage prohead protease
MDDKKNKLPELERRSYMCEVRADGEDEAREATIIGRPIVFGSRTDLGYFDEIIEAGALNNTDLNDVRFLVNHDFSRIPLARSRRNNANSTMQLIPDEAGLMIKATIDKEANADARALDSAVRRGDISGMSFAFSVSGEAWDDLDTEHPTRRITEISSVVEVSAVTFPAYDATEIYARSAEALESAKAKLESERQRKAEERKAQLEALETRINSLMEG